MTEKSKQISIDWRELFHKQGYDAAVLDIANALGVSDKLLRFKIADMKVRNKAPVAVRVSVDGEVLWERRYTHRR